MAKEIFLPVSMNDKDIVKEKNIMDEIVNMEVRDAGQLEQRVEQETFSSNLNTAIATKFATVLPLTCEEPFYPARIPTVMYDSADYMIPVFGIDSGGDYLLYIFYETASGTWGSTKIDLESSGIVYTSSSSIIIKNIRDMMLVLDYDGRNEPHYLSINEDKEIVYDLVKNSVARPDTAISFDDIDGNTNRGNIFTSEENDGFSSPKLFRWFYTIVNIFGDEGNPSPGSVAYDLGFHSTDTDNLQQQWVEGVLLDGMSLPTGATDKMKDEAHKYRLYRQECNDASSYVFTQPQFVAEIDILNVDGATSYLDTITVGTSSRLLSFSNNRAPIARDAELVGESIMLSKLKLKPEIIADFDVIMPIKITNPNSETYPNGITRIRLEFDISGESADMWKYPIFDYLLSHKDKLRLFDSDLATPIPVIYDDTELSKFDEDITDTDFATSCGVNWACGTGWTIYPTAGEAAADNATGDIVEAGVLSNDAHLITIIHGGLTVDDNFEIDYGGVGNLLIEDSLQIGVGKYLFTAKTTAQGAAQDFKITPVAATGTGKFYYASALSIGTTNLIDIFARIPFLESGQQRKLFLVFCLMGSDTNGVANLPHWDDCGEYGEFQDYKETAQWALQKTFVEPAIVSGELICSPETFFSVTLHVFNKANELNPGGIAGGATHYATQIDINRIPSLNPTCYVPGMKSIRMNPGSANGGIKYYTDIYFEKLTLPSKFTKAVKLKFSKADLHDNHGDANPEHSNSIMTIYKDSNEFVICYLFFDAADSFATIKIYGIDASGNLTIDTGIEIPVAAGDDSFQITFSVNLLLETASIFVLNMENVDEWWAERADTIVEYLMDMGADSAMIYFGEVVGETVPIEDAYYTDIHFIERFYDTGSDSDNSINSGDVNALINMANYMPPQRTSIVGYKHIEGRWAGTAIAITLTTTITLAGVDMVSRFEDADELYIDGGASDGILATITSVALVGLDTVIVSSTTLVNQATGTAHILTGKKHNNNIIIDTDDIELIEYKEHKNTAMFTNANGMSFPPGNIKIADRPILRQIKTPTTLAEMRNSLIWFYRNGFTRYIAEGDPSTWADATNLKIPQLSGRGLMAENSVAVTDQGVVWFAEKGIQLLNGIEPITISEMFDIPIKDTYRHWYCSLTKQYALHDNEFISFTKLLNINVNKTMEIDDATTWASLNVVVGDRFALSGTANNEGYFTITAITTNVITVSETCTNESISSTVKISKDWVINLVTKETTTFRSLDMLSAMSISGGSTVDNVIIVLNQFNEIDVYPDYDNGKYTDALTKVKKVIREHYADFVSILAKYGKASGNVQIKAQIEDPVGDLTDALAYTDLEDFRTKMLPISFIGNKLTIELRDAETLEYFIVDIMKMNTPI